MGSSPHGKRCSQTEESASKSSNKRRRYGLHAHTRPLSVKEAAFVASYLEEQKHPCERFTLNESEGKPSIRLSHYEFNKDAPFQLVMANERRPYIPTGKEADLFLFRQALKIIDAKELPINDMEQLEMQLVMELTLSFAMHDVEARVHDVLSQGALALDQKLEMDRRLQGIVEDLQAMVQSTKEIAVRAEQTAIRAEVKANAAALWGQTAVRAEQTAIRAETKAQQTAAAMRQRLTVLEQQRDQQAHAARAAQQKLIVLEQQRHDQARAMQEQPAQAHAAQQMAHATQQRLAAWEQQREKDYIGSPFYSILFVLPVSITSFERTSAISSLTIGLSNW